VCAGWQKNRDAFQNGKMRTVGSAVLNEKSRFSVDIISQVAELTELFRGDYSQGKHHWRSQIVIINQRFEMGSVEVFRCLGCFGEPFMAFGFPKDVVDVIQRAKKALENDKKELY